MDTLASLALATEPPTTHLLDRLPYKKTDHMISKVKIFYKKKKKNFILLDNVQTYPRTSNLSVDYFMYINF